MNARNEVERSPSAARNVWIPLMLRLGPKLGLSRQIVRSAFKRMNSRKLKQRAFAGYEPSEHDVIVATFAKSGTNWMMQIAQQIAHLGDAEFDHIHDLIPWPDTPVPVPISLADTSVRLQSPTGLRVIKTHLETEFVPYSEKATYLTVLRDPKDVLVSSYYFLGGMMGVLNHLSIDDWFEIFIRPESLAASWARHTASFWGWRDRPNVLVLNFRVIRDEPRASIERVAAMMGVTLPDDKLEQVIERSSFDYMKEHESQFSPPKLPYMKESDRPLMLRRGTTGESDELLSQVQQAAVDRLCQAELERLGSDFPYADAFDVVSDSAKPAT